MVDSHWPQGWPDRNAEYLLFQTLVGAWPLSVERAVAYMEKASKEAKTRTSWVDADPEYDESLRTFVERVLADERFLADLGEFVEPLVEPGRVVSLAQQLLRLTSPGVPDTYQGTELWDLSLVDPDNRRPVDFDERRRLLESLGDDGDEVDPSDVLARTDEGLPKLWLTRQALRLRRRRPELFGPEGAYEPLKAAGARGAHVVAFVRGGGAATVVPRLVVGLDGAGGWEDTTIDVPAGRWRNLLTGNAVDGGEVSLSALLARFPVALLELS
jgi:(1->4)-alpha-D-glucan 1-alpha-D-glucosylmutase